MSVAVLGWQLKAAGILALTLGVAWALRWSSANGRRRWLSWGLLAALVAPPLGLAVGSSVGMTMSVADVQMPSLLMATLAPSTPVAANAAEVVDAAATAAPADPTLDWASLGVGLWLGGALFGVLWVMSGVWGGALLRRDALCPSARLLKLHRAAASDLGVTASLRLHDRPSVPIVVGIWRPTVLLPRSAESWCDARVRAVLLHELAHVSHHDHRWFPALALARALLWVNPLAWLDLRRVHREAEFAADAAAVDGGMRASSYAAELLALSRISLLPVTGIPAPALGHPRLGERIRRVLESPRDLARLRRVVPVTVGAIGAMLAIAVVRTEPTAADATSLVKRSQPEQVAVAVDSRFRLPIVDAGTTTVALGAGPRVHLSRDALVAVGLGAGGAHALELPLSDGHFSDEDTQGHVITALLDGLTAVGSVDRTDALVLWADRDTPYRTIVDAAYTGGRAGYLRYRLAVRVDDRVRAVDVSPPMMNAAPAFSLRVTWGPGSVRAVTFEELGDPGRSSVFRDRWSVEREDGPAMARVARAACAYSGGHPVSLIVRPLGEVPYAELIETIQEGRRPCGGGTIIEAGA